MTFPARKPATLEEFLAAEAGGRSVELVDGVIVEKAAPSFEHGAIQARSSATVDPFNRRGGGGGAPGGWWIGTEVDVLYEKTGEVFRHDLAGWRRDRHADKPSGLPVRARPDWACEILSPSTAGRDQVKKLRTLHAHAVEHYWILDPERTTLFVHRYASEAYLIVLTATVDETVRAEPFDAIEIRVADLFGVE